MKQRILLLILSLSMAALAEEPLAGRMRALFALADSDRDGALSAPEQAKAVEQVRSQYGADWAKRIGVMFAKAGAGQGIVTAEAWRKEIDATMKRRSEKLTEMVAMRDGIRLATDIFFPAGDGPFPVVLSRTPYSRAKQGQKAGGYQREGYVFVIQDMRGRFDSEGENLPFIGCGWEKHQDGVDTIEWLKKQSWCNGAIATIGASAGGITQNFLAAAAPAGLGLRAQYIIVAANSMYGDASYIGNAFRKGDVENWLNGNEFDPRALEISRSRPGYDEYWAGFDTTRRFSVMDVPAVHVGGWYDMFAQATIDQFCGRQQQGGPGSRGKQKLVMGPWAHGIGKAQVGEFTFPEASRVPKDYDSDRWFAHHLRGEPNGIDREPAVAYYVMGDTRTPGAPGNEWRYAEAWPVPAKDTSLYFHEPKTLIWEAPDADAAHVEYTFDPASPCPTTGGNNLTIPSGPLDQSSVEKRADVISFTSEPLDKPVEITGRVRAMVFISSSAVDTDLSVRLCDVHPDGRSFLIAEGIQRLRYRNSTGTPEPLTPGKIEEVKVDCWSTSMIFDRGHRLRVSVTSSNYPRFDLNPGTSLPWTEDGEKVKQTNRIYCDAGHPSQLVVPVVEEK